MRAPRARFIGVLDNAPVRSEVTGCDSHKYPLILSRIVESQVFRALADPTRRAVFERLCRGESSVSELTARFAVSQPAISQHLAALKAAGLVCERREGRNAFYRCDPRGLDSLSNWVQ